MSARGAAEVPARPGALRAWLMAARLPTLTGAVAPVLVGSGVAIGDGAFAAGPAAAALFGAVALQVAANFANDLSDFRRGADTAQRIGPQRVTAGGLLSERQVLGGTLAVIAAAAVAGLYLAAVAGWPVIAVGLASIVAAVTYTGGPWPFGYRGLGEVFVFLFFGVVAVSGTYFVQAGTLTGSALLASLPAGCTVTAILVVNNVRDIETDRVAGKRTLAVLLGRARTRALFVAIVGGAYALAALPWLVGGSGPWVLLTWLTLPLAAAPARAVLTRTDGPPLNAALRATARLHFAFGLMLAIGVAL